MSFSFRPQHSEVEKAAQHQRVTNSLRERAHTVEYALHRAGNGSHVEGLAALVSDIIACVGSEALIRAILKYEPWRGVDAATITDAYAARVADRKAEDDRRNG